MRSVDGQIAIVFNGAIYNFRQLRHGLEQSGTTFTSQTDTEVLLRGYLAWGIDALVARIRGMFAFVVWDARSHTAYLVRDRLGVKPLVYAERDGELAFASTPRALRAAGVVSGELDMLAVAEFLEHGYVTEAHSIYAGIRKLPPASIGEWKNGRLRIRRYWKSPTPGSAPRSTFADAVDQTETLLLAAVERRLDADVPVGALLSGGIDSGLVCWAISRLGGSVKAYTVGAPGDPTDESLHARETARELGIAHEILPLTDSEPADLTNLVTAYAEPFAVESALGMLSVSRAIAETGTKVLLTGDGGDDVFLGYPRHRHLLLAERLAHYTPGVATSLWKGVRKAVPRRGLLGRGVHLADYVVGGLPAYLDAHDGLPFYARHGLFAERLQDAKVAQRGGTWSIASARRLLEEYIEHDLDHQFVSEYLTKVDGATMHYALEARAPFLDQDLWEFAASLPATLRLHRGELKAILREVSRRRIGPRVAGLRKRGFAVPVQRWLSRRWRDTLEETLQNSELQRLGWLQSDRAAELLRHVAVGGQVPKQLWYIFVLEQWLRAEKQWQPSPEIESTTRIKATAG
jgi:asparagine synthase (glutamine-hydrolysing)